MRNLFLFFFNIFLLVIPFFIPLFTLNIDVSTILTILSLLFAIIAGFAIAAATSNHLRMQSLIADEDAGLIEIYNLSKLISPSAAERVADAIDKYMIASLDHDLLTYAANTTTELKEIMDAVDEVMPKNDRGLSLFQNLHNRKNSLHTIVQETRLTAKTIVGFRHWLILILLAVLIGVLLLALRDGAFWTTAFISVLIYCTFQILNLIREIDTNLLLAQKLAFENPQVVFTEIGKEYYYPEYALKMGSVKPQVSRYRVGKEPQKGGAREIILHQ